MSDSMIPMANPGHVTLDTFGVQMWYAYMSSHGVPYADGTTVFSVHPNDDLDGRAYLLTHPQGGKDLYFMRHQCIPVEFDTNFGVWKTIV